MKKKKILVALSLFLMSAAVGSAQEGEATVAGVSVVEEIVTDSTCADAGNAGRAVPHRKVGSWTVTYMSDTIDSTEAGNLMEELFEDYEGLDKLIGGLAGVGAATGGLLIAALALFCVFGLPILGIILIVWLVVRASRRNNPTAGQCNIDERGKDRTLFNKGVRNVSLGIGLAIFLGICLGDFGIGVGALVACIGIGELLIDYFAKK